MRWMILIILFMIPLVSSAQATDTPTPTFTPDFFANVNETTEARQCGNGLPCGAIPWRLPDMPVLYSPTPLDLSHLVADPENPTDTPTPTETPNVLGEATQIGGVLDELTIDLTGTPIEFEVTPEDEYENIITNSGNFFGYMKAILEMDMGVLTPLLVGLATFISLTLLLKVTMLIIPIVGVFVGIVRKIIELIPGE